MIPFLFLLILFWNIRRNPRDGYQKDTILLLLINHFHPKEVRRNCVGKHWWGSGENRQCSSKWAHRWKHYVDIYLSHSHRYPSPLLIEQRSIDLTDCFEGFSILIAENSWTFVYRKYPIRTPIDSYKYIWSISFIYSTVHHLSPQYVTVVEIYS